jgi:hypothetical protein
VQPLQVELRHSLLLRSCSLCFEEINASFGFPCFRLALAVNFVQKWKVEYRILQKWHSVSKPSKRGFH